MSWDVLVPKAKGSRYKLIDTVWFDSNCDADYIRSSLINHDGYPHNIIVRPVK